MFEENIIVCCYNCTVMEICRKYVVRNAQTELQNLKSEIFVSVYFDTSLGFLFITFSNLSGFIPFHFKILINNL